MIEQIYIPGEVIIEQNKIYKKIFFVADGAIEIVIYNE